MKHYYIAFSSPCGFGTLFYRGKEHPLAPNAYADRINGLANKINIKFGAQIMPESIVYLNIVELPLEVAKERWPEDFT
jgi:hypothetical protein